MAYIYLSRARDIKLSILLSLLFANIRILSCLFFLFLVMFNNFFIIPVVMANSTVNTALEFQLEHLQY